MSPLLAHFTSLTAVEADYALRLIVAAALGTVLGLERSIAGKHAGMRTYAMVALGSALFVITETFASYQLADFKSINPLQIAGSIVIGIGFIGSGLAVMRGDHPGEITTASGLWVAAGIGMACGFGLYFLGGATVVISLVIFSLLAWLERRLRSRYGVSN